MAGLFGHGSAGDGGTAASTYEADAAEDQDPGTPMAQVDDAEDAGPDECEVPQ